MGIPSSSGETLLTPTPQAKSLSRTLGVEAAYLVLVSARPRQWTKNLLVYFPFIFTVNLQWTPEALAEALGLLGRCTLAFLLLCVVSGATYLVNDYLDRHQDRVHPRKQNRPIAAGRLKPPVALTAAVFLSAGGVALSFLLAPAFGGVVLLYLVLMLGYSLLLKHLVILDVLTIGAGFVLRAVAGAVVISAPISPWLYVVTALGALFIGFGKRRTELISAGDGGAASQRGILQEYSPALLDHLIGIVAPSALLAYMLYTFTADNLPTNNAMMLTIPFVAYGLFRYLYLIHRTPLGERPEDALLDPPLLVTVVLWLATALTILFLFRT